MKSFRDILISALALMLIGGVVTAALAGTNVLTEDIIAERALKIENEARVDVIDADEFQSETRTIDGEVVTYHRAVKEGETVGYVFTATVSGKSSGLTVMTAISLEGHVTGVKITADNETAGYVDKVVKAGFLDALKGHDATAITDVDAVSQATKTSNGVLKAVNMAVTWYDGVKGGDADA